MSKKPTVMSTNAGTKVLKLDADIGGFCVAKFDPTQMANIMRFSHMADKHRITYDNSVEDAFFVHSNTGIIKFVRDGCLYTYKPSTNYLDAVVASKGMCDSNDISKEFDNRCKRLHSRQKSMLVSTPFS